MEWSIEVVAGICHAVILHHLAAVMRCLHAQVVVFVLNKWYFMMEFALMPLYAQV